MTKSFQHYVPNFLLEFFAIEGHLFVYDREDKVIRKQTPRSTAGEKNYYIITTKKGVESDLVEKMFSQIEKHAAKIIKKINTGDHNLNAQEKADLAMFLAALYLRTPHSINKSHEMSKKMTQEIMKRSAMFEPYFEKGMKAIQKKHGYKLTQKEKDDIRETVIKKKYKLEFPKGYLLKTMVMIMQDTYYYFAQMEWTILSTSRGRKFITSDNPVYTMNIKPEGFMGSGIGLFAPNCETIAVLTPSVAIFLSQNHNPEAVYSELARKKLVDNINKRTAICSTRFVVSKNRKLLGKIIKNVQLEKKKQYGRVKIS